MSWVLCYIILHYSLLNSSFFQGLYRPANCTAGVFYTFLFNYVCFLSGCLGPTLQSIFDPLTLNQLIVCQWDFHVMQGPHQNRMRVQGDDSAIFVYQGWTPGAKYSTFLMKISYLMLSNFTHKCIVNENAHLRIYRAVPHQELRGEIICYVFD